MKELTEGSCDLSESEWTQLFYYIKKYNNYVSDRLKTIMDFDIWYENSNGVDFPKEWYTMIRDSNSNK